MKNFLSFMFIACRDIEPTLDLLLGTGADDEVLVDVLMENCYTCPTIY